MTDETSGLTSDTGDTVLARQDAAGQLGLFRDGRLIRLLDAPPAGPLGPGCEVLKVCPRHPDASVVDCVACDVTGETSLPADLLTKQDLARIKGVQVATISRGLAESRARVAGGLPLRPMDTPLPEPVSPLSWRGQGRPVWRADRADVRAYLGRGRNARTSTLDM